MLFDGKRPDEMTKDELESAAAYCARMVAQAEAVRELNKAGLAELSLEYDRRLGLPAGVMLS
jgi:hypothetical protein